jgi:hemerythrin-like domain-containing protein
MKRWMNLSPHYQRSYSVSEQDQSNNPIKQLLDEHVAFRISCNDLLGFIERLERDGYRATITTSDYALMLKTRENIREHLNVHLIKEEEIFFPRLEKLVPQGRIKFLYLNYDHEYLRNYFEDFCSIVSDFENDRVPMHVTIRRLIETGRLIIHNLLQHILAEDTVYFEVAESGFSKSELDEMGNEMKRLEAKLKEQL